MQKSLAISIALVALVGSMVKLPPSAIGAKSMGGMDAGGRVGARNGTKDGVGG